MVYDTNGTTANVWPNWVLYEDSSSTGGYANSYIWQGWVTGGTSGNSTAWTYWIQEGGTGDVTSSRICGSAVGSAAGFKQPTPEELEAQKKAREDWDRQQEEARKARERADKRARKLFLDVIGRNQYRMFRRKKHLEVVAASGKRYRLKLHARVEEMAGMFGDKVASYLCVHPDGVPAYDALLTQLLFLVSGKETEEKLVKTANRTPAVA